MPVAFELAYHQISNPATLLNLTNFGFRAKFSLRAGITKIVVIGFDINDIFSLLIG
jgi:hypothetical protein